jgi:hypothetical protein
VLGLPCAFIEIGFNKECFMYLKKLFVFALILSVSLPMFARNANAPAGDIFNSGRLTPVEGNGTNISSDAEKHNCPAETEMGAQKAPNQAEIYNMVGIYCSYEWYRAINQKSYSKEIHELRYHAGYLIRFMILSKTKSENVKEYAMEFDVIRGYEKEKTDLNKAKNAYKSLILDMERFLTKEYIRVRMAAEAKEKEVRGYTGHDIIAHSEMYIGQDYDTRKAQSDKLTAEARSLFYRKLAD